MAGSYDELAPHERVLVNVLAVFAGGFRLQAAPAVASAVGLAPEQVADWVAGLVLRSLVIEYDGSPARYELSESLRGPAERALNSSPQQEAIRRAHLDWARSFAQEGAVALEGSEQGRWLQELDREHDNFRAALDWGTNRRDCEAALALAGALGRFWEVRGHIAEGRRWLDLALRQNPAASPGARASAANSAGLLAFRAGDHSGARAIYEDSLAIHWEMGDRLGSAGVLHSMGNLAFQERDWKEAKRLFEESLAIGRELRDDRVIAASLTNLGAVAEVHRDFGTALALYDEALATWRTLGDSHNAAGVLDNLVNVSLEFGDMPAARRWATQTLEARRSVGDTQGMASALNKLAVIARRQGDAEAVRAFRQEAAALGGPGSGGWLARFRRRPDR